MGLQVETCCHMISLVPSGCFALRRPARSYLPTTDHRPPTISYQLPATTYQLRSPWSVAEWDQLSATTCRLRHKNPSYCRFCRIENPHALCYALINQEHTFCPHAHPPRKELCSCRQHYKLLLKLKWTQSTSAHKLPVKWESRTYRCAASPA